MPIFADKSKKSSTITYKVSLELVKPFMFILLFFDNKASTDFPFPKPCRFTFSTLFKPMLSFLEILNRMVLLTPESKIKDNVLPFISKGITIKLLINLKCTRSFTVFLSKKEKPL